MADFDDGLDVAQQTKVRDFLAKHHRHSESDGDRGHRN